MRAIVVGAGIGGLAATLSAMVPFQAQGAAQAIMDAAVLGHVLTDATPADVPEALERYARQRNANATTVQASSARAGADYHLPDGPEAEARNKRMVAIAAENEFGAHAASWGVDVV
ncbi:FAD-dependent oxidoreductase [Streptomyces sp. NPDC001617]